MARRAIRIPLNSYSDSLQGHYEGEIYRSPSTGKTFRLVRAHTTLAGTSIPLYAPVVKVGATGCVGTDAVAAGLDTDYPIPLGFACAACPASTSSTSYYFWVQTYGVVETDPTAISGAGTAAGVPTDGGDDIVLGDLIFAKAADGVVDQVPVAETVTAAGKLGPRIMGYALADDNDVADTVAVFATLLP